MTWLLAALIAIAFVEILLRLPLMRVLALLLARLRQVRRVIASPRISDHWKEKTLVVYAGGLLQHSLIIFGLLAFASAVIVLAGTAMTLAFDADLPGFLLTVKGTLFATAVSLGYALARSRLARFRLVPRQL